ELEVRVLDRVLASFRDLMRPDGPDAWEHDRAAFGDPHLIEEATHHIDGLGSVPEAVDDRLANQNRQLRRAQGALELDPLVAGKGDVFTLLAGLGLDSVDKVLHQATVFGLEVFLAVFELLQLLLHGVVPPSAVSQGAYLTKRTWTAPTEPGRSQPGGVPTVSVCRYSTRSSVSTPGTEAGVTVSWLLVRFRLYWSVDSCVPPRNTRRVPASILAIRSSCTVADTLFAGYTNFVTRTVWDTWSPVVRPGMPLYSLKGPGLR